MQELQEIKDVIVAERGENYLKTHKMLEDSLAKQGEQLKEINHLQSQVLLDSIKIQGKECQLTIIGYHLGKMLSELEGAFDRGEEFSYEFAADYIEAATAAKSLGREGDRIKEVTEWMNSQDSLPW